MEILKNKRNQPSNFNRERENNVSHRQMDSADIENYRVVLQSNIFVKMLKPALNPMKAGIPPCPSVVSPPAFSK